jgi:hypothetical protein
MSRPVLQGDLVRFNAVAPAEYRDEEGEVVAHVAGLTVELEDGHKVECRPDQVVGFGPWAVDLLPDDPTWRVAANPHGAGVLLLVERGGRTQVFSGPTEHPVDYWQARRAVDRIRARLAGRITRFREQSADWGVTPFAEASVVLFCVGVAECVAKECERG